MFLIAYNLNFTTFYVFHKLKICIKIHTPLYKFNVFTIKQFLTKYSILTFTINIVINKSDHYYQ